MTKGVYPQSDGKLAMIDIDASKGLVDLWEHFFVAIVAIKILSKWISMEEVFFLVSTEFKHV